MTLRQVCNVVYATLVSGADKEARQKFDNDLNAPLGKTWAQVERDVIRLFAEEA